MSEIKFLLTDNDEIKHQINLARVVIAINKKAVANFETAELLSDLANAAKQRIAEKEKEIEQLKSKLAKPVLVISEENMLHPEVLSIITNKLKNEIIVVTAKELSEKLNNLSQNNDIISTTVIKPFEIKPVECYVDENFKSGREKRRERRKKSKK